jgi:hypothetical protein
MTAYSLCVDGAEAETRVQMRTTCAPVILTYVLERKEALTGSYMFYLIVLRLGGSVLPYMTTPIRCMNAGQGQ